MRLFLSSIGLSLLTTVLFGQGKTDKPVDVNQFFSDERPLTVKLTADMNKVQNKKTNGEYMDAVFNCTFPDGSTITEPIRVHAKGIFRRNYCAIPPLKLNFHNPTSPLLSPLHSLKLTFACKKGPYYDQLVFKEYLVNKMYNLLTDKSFKVRMAYATIEDDKDKKKPVTQYAFLTEDIAEVAKRNQCKELTNEKVGTEATNREQMTLVALFEYMIGNTDWDVPFKHNIRLIRSKTDTTSSPFAVALDFDASGMVNADYASVDPQMGTETVLERVYRGFPRSMAELEKSLKIFMTQKEKIYSLVKNFSLLSSHNRDEMIHYLDEFYSDISDPKKIQELFITNARTQ